MCNLVNLNDIFYHPLTSLNATKHYESLLSENDWWTDWWHDFR